MTIKLSWGRKCYGLLVKTETGLLVALLLSMILMAVVQILMRNILGSGIIWAESFVRIAVLWIALVGAMIGSRSGHHIAIDVLVHYVSESTQLHLQRVTDIFTAGICFVIAYYSYLFVMLEFENGGLAFSVVPNWLCESIIPFAFVVIGSRYLVAGIFSIRHEEI